MAKSEILKPFVLSWEGGYTDDPDDRGGATNRGVTLAVYRSVMGTGKTKDDLRRITDAEWDTVFRALYWDKCMGDAVDDQSVANMLVDFAWHSGTSRAVKALQAVVGAKQDGVMGRKTLHAVNASDVGAVFRQLKARRTAFLKGIAKGAQRKYLKGWLGRVEAIGYGSLTYGGKKVEF